VHEVENSSKLPAYLVSWHECKIFLQNRSFQDQYYINNSLAAANMVKSSIGVIFAVKINAFGELHLVICESLSKISEATAADYI